MIKNKSRTDNRANIYQVTAITLIICLSYVLFSSLRVNYGAPRMDVSNHYLNAGVQETGSINIVTAILLNYRAYDTLGEVVMLIIAVAGTILLMRGANKW